ncbi:hypothetical protein ES705_37169 [subsurface metagenome]
MITFRFPVLLFSWHYPPTFYGIVRFFSPENRFTVPFSQLSRIFTFSCLCVNSGMKILLEVKGIGILGIDPHNYVVADGVSLDKKGGKNFVNARYFGTLPYALEELREVYQAKGLAKGKPAETIAEFIGRVERISKSWFNLIGNAELSGLKERLPQPTE